jgi:hypothetical protein
MTTAEGSGAAFSSSVIAARNWSADTKGSIHDDATASKLGFRGGTVAGSIHMDQFVSLLVSVYGAAWLERGFLSLYFQNATTDRERVSTHASAPEPPGGSVAVWMTRDDGLEVMRGDAGLGDASASTLRTRDLRASSGDGLRIVSDAADRKLGPLAVHLDSTAQRERVEQGLISDPLPCYSDASEYGGLVASPSTLVELLWRAPTEALGQYVRKAVGLFGAIEVAHLRGPVLLDREYEVRAEVIAVGESPKTEFLWFDSVAHDAAGSPVASMRMLLRFMKASSKAYA